MLCLKSPDGRFIPAPVGNTGTVIGPPSVTTVHPRLRGEHFRPPYGKENIDGSSPQPWGTLQVDLRYQPMERFIPA